MRRRRSKENEEPGQDSFLDIVANLVGIMVILVMIVGARARQAIVESQSEKIQTVQEPSPNVPLRNASFAAAEVEADINDITHRLIERKVIVAARRQERDRLAALLVAAEQDLEEKRLQLSQTQQDQYRHASIVAEKEKELKEVQQAAWLLANAPPTPKALEHIPTPLATTVLNTEVFFRLKYGKLTYVPMEELGELLQTDRSTPKRHDNTITKVVGPIEGFRMTVVGVRDADGVTFRAAYEPMNDRIGEPLSQAIQPGSRFERILAMQTGGDDPANITVTLWVYPDSFAELRALKRNLYDRGYTIAVWPLSQNEPITASSKGRKSVRQ